MMGMWSGGIQSETPSFHKSHLTFPHAETALCISSWYCSIRSLCKTVQTMLNGVLSKIILQDLLVNEQPVELFVTNLTEELEKNSTDHKSH